MTVFTIACHQQWIWEAFDSALPQGLYNTQSGEKNGIQLRHHMDLWPLDDLRCHDPLWSTSDFLIAQNARMRSMGMTPMLMLTPQDDWPSSLGKDLLGRNAVVSHPSSILQWNSFEDSGVSGLSPSSRISEAPGRPTSRESQPWSQLINARVPSFPAAQRDLRTLQQALSNAPSNSSVLISEHIPDITEEWMVVVHRFRAIATHGYCIHQAQSGRQVLSVFDGAKFAESNISRVEAAAQEAARRLNIISAVFNIAISANSGVLVLEPLPSWCTPPYEYGADATEALLEAIAVCSLTPSGKVLHDQSEITIPTQQIFRPDPWMEQYFARRFLTENRATSTDTSQQ